MYTAKGAVRNIAAMFIGTGFNNILNFLLLAYIARYLGPVGFGEYSFIITYFFFFGALTAFGIIKVVVRDLSKDSTQKDEIIGKTLSTKILISIFALIISILVIKLMNYSDHTRILVYIASITILLKGIADTYSLIFVTYLKMIYIQISNLVSSLAYILLVVFIITSKGDILYIVIGLVIRDIINTSLIFYFSKKFIRPRFVFDVSYAKKLVLTSVPVGLALLFRTVYYRIDVIMISIMKSNRDVGYYSAAYNLLKGLEMIPTAFMLTLYPIMSYYFDTANEKLSELYEKSFKLFFIISLPIAIGTTVFSNEIIRLIYGDKFLPSALSLSVLIWAMVFSFSNNIFSNLLISMNKEKFTMYVSGLLGLVNIILNLAVIPTYSFVGASATTTFTEALGAVIFYAYIYKNLIKKSLLLIISKIVLVNSAFLLFLLAAKQMFIFTKIALIMVIFISVIVYGVLILKSGCITRDEIVLLRSMTRK